MQISTSNLNILKKKSASLCPFFHPTYMHAAWTACRAVARAPPLLFARDESRPACRSSIFHCETFPELNYSTARRKRIPWRPATLFKRRVERSIWRKRRRPLSMPRSYKRRPLGLQLSLIEGCLPLTRRNNQREIESGLKKKNGSSAGL